MVVAGVLIHFLNFQIDPKISLESSMFNMFNLTGPWKVGASIVIYVVYVKAFKDTKLLEKYCNFYKLHRAFKKFIIFALPLPKTDHNLLFSFVRKLANYMTLIVVNGSLQPEG